MHSRTFTHLTAVALVFSAFSSGFFATRANAAQVPEELKAVGITEHLGSAVSIGELTFRDEKNQPVRLGEYFKAGKPVLLNLVYFECPSLCSFVLNGLVKSLRGLDWTPGTQFEVITLSIDPTEKAELAAAKKESYIASFGRPESAQGWHFLTGEESQIKKLADQVGFGYRYDKDEKQYAHSAAIFTLTPEGKISRYLYGIEYPSRDLKLSLIEASSGKIGTIMERFMLFCYRYDPKTKKYSVYVTRLLQTGAVATVLALSLYLGIFWTRQRRLGSAA
jgi:protein SCO1/2